VARAVPTALPVTNEVHRCPIPDGVKLSNGYWMIPDDKEYEFTCKSGYLRSDATSQDERSSLWCKNGTVSYKTKGCTPFHLDTLPGLNINLDGLAASPLQIDPNGPSPLVGSSCVGVDSNPSCNSWALAGLCSDSTTKSFMLTNCARSCNPACSGSGKYTRHDNQECAYYSSDAQQVNIGKKTHEECKRECDKITGINCKAVVINPYGVCYLNGFKPTVSDPNLICKSESNGLSKEKFTSYVKS
jgi:hypothetical protein